MRFGLRIPPCRPADEVARCVADAERAGFEIAWLPDSQFLWRDVWACTALAAARTERIVVGTCVTNLETRHASVTAAAAVTLEELAPGRTILGLGSGDSAVKTLGKRPTRLAELRDGVELVRRLMRGETVRFDDREMRLHASLATPPPVYLAANGPKALALAGEIADGVITVAGLEAGQVAALRSRVGHRVDVAFGTFCHITDDEREAARIAADAAEEWVTDEQALRYADAYCLVGSLDSVAERIARAEAAGVANLYVRHFESYTLPDRLLRAFAELIG
jgi:5,10-methylenetetrahydromethanopterin reductase